MIKYIFSFVLLIHGLIHMMGFVKAFGLGQIAQLTKVISKPVGAVWLATTMLFVVAMVLFLLKKESWPLLAIIAVALSQVLVFTTWQDAKFGTIANIIILIVALFGWTSQHFESQFRMDVNTNLNKSTIGTPDLLTEVDIQTLPIPVQRYLRYAGVLNQPKVSNARITFEGEMRSKNGEWFRFNSVQYNFFNEPARLFFMKAQMYKIPVLGYHQFQDATATMDIRLAGLVPVAKSSGPELNKAETVTYFNDMCMFVPAALVDDRITWEPIDTTSAKATFSHGDNTISAVLYFNEIGQLINFVSDDRYDVNSMKQYRFSTPLSDYKLINDRNTPGYGEGVWHYPDGEFVYGKFYLRDIEYNVS
ncbi:MAG: hypothetical protein RH948_00670 [Cyclobacteriaceae bacterium]